MGRDVKAEKGKKRKKTWRREAWMGEADGWGGEVDGHDHDDVGDGLFVFGGGGGRVAELCAVLFTNGDACSHHDV